MEAFAMKHFLAVSQLLVSTSLRLISAALLLTIAAETRPVHAAPVPQALRMSCSSDDMRRHVCPVDTSGGVQMVHQKSEAKCIQNRTWGYDKRGIWADRGCRADFAVTGDWQARAAALVYCPSDDMQRNFCAVNTLDGVFIVRQRSEADCVFNRTWGYDRDRIWVDRGCRADFEVIDRRDREWRAWSRDWDDDDRRGWDRDHGRDRDRDEYRDRDDRPPYLN